MDRCASAWENYQTVKPMLMNVVHLNVSSDEDMKYLKVQHDFNQFTAIGRRQTTSLVQDYFQLRTGQLIKV